jgi:hypothetical protein
MSELTNRLHLTASNLSIPLCDEAADRIKHYEAALGRMGDQDEMVDSESVKSHLNWALKEIDARTEYARKALND